MQLVKIANQNIIKYSLKAWCKFIECYSEKVQFFMFG